VSDEQTLRELHRIIDARVRQYMDDHAPMEVRGIVTSVQSDVRRLAARLDLGDVPTTNITYPVGMTPLEGDDVLVMRRGDGLLLVRDILGREEA